MSKKPQMSKQQRSKKLKSLISDGVMMCMSTSLVGNWKNQLDELEEEIEADTKADKERARKFIKDGDKSLWFIYDKVLNEALDIALAERDKEILNIINQDRDNGNIPTVNGVRGFSPALCLSKVLKELEKNENKYTQKRIL